MTIAVFILLLAGSAFAVCSATGGTITEAGGYRIHTFTANGTFNVTGSCNAEVLVVAGGGGGGSGFGGGGGGGGLIYNAAYSASGAIAVTVGTGGGTNTNGANSVFGSLTAIGGGAGGGAPSWNAAEAGHSGGSGGGGGAQYYTGYSGGSGTSGQGNAGGASRAYSSSSYASAGGGGAGAVGGAPGASAAGDGGIGLSFNVSGTPTYYAGGGGGYYYHENPVYGSIGNNGAGAIGGGGSPSTTGGTGIVIVKYSTTVESFTGTYYYTSCSDILYSGASTGNGLYTIDPDGTGSLAPITTYCDMANGGWTLVLLNSPYSVPPQPSWSDAINFNSVMGNQTGNLNGDYDQLVGLGYWNYLGNELRAETGSSSSSISHRATYNFSLNSGNYYSIALSTEAIPIGGTSPGLKYFSAANSYGFTTYEADHDVYSANCANSYGQTPWWYGACWDGNFWGGGTSGSYQNKPFWTGASTDYYDWGAIWVRFAPPVAYWKLNETSGTSAADSAGSNTGTVSGATWTTSGKSGGALSFNGVNQYMMLPATSQFDVQAHTIEAWVRSSNFVQNGFIFEKTTNGAVNTQYSCFFSSGNLLYYRTINTTGGMDDLTLNISSYFTNNQWNHVACVYTGANKYIYVNGVQAATKAYSQAIATNPAGTSIIGAYGSGTSYFFNGTMDEVKLYNRALSAAEIASQYNNATSGQCGSGGKVLMINGSCVHIFTASGTFTPPAATNVAALVVAGGGGGGMDMGGGGGAGGYIYNASYPVTLQAYPVTVGMGGHGGPSAKTAGQPTAHAYTISATNGQNSAFGTMTAIGGGRGGSSYVGYTPGATGASGGSGGGASGYSDGAAAGTYAGGSGTSGQGYAGGSMGSQYYSGGGGGAGGAGASGNNQPNGGAGISNSILGTAFYWAGGGGGASYSSSVGGNGGAGGGGGGAVGTTTGGGSAINSGKAGGGGSPNSQTNTPGGHAGPSTGGGGGGGSHYNATNRGGEGGSGIVVLSYAASAGLQCGALSTAGTTYSMTANLNSATTCFTVTAANVTLNCNGYSITGNNAAATIGVYGQGESLTVKNCNIVNFSIGLFSNKNYTTFINNNVTQNYVDDYAIWLAFGKGNVVANNIVNSKVYTFGINNGASNGTYANNTVTVSGANASIFLTNAPNNNYINNTIIFTGTGAARAYDITGANNTIDCRGASITGANTSGSYGIYSAAFNTTVRNCNISNFATGIMFVGATNGAISNNTVSTTSASATAPGYAFAIALSTSANYNLLSNNTASAVRGSYLIMSGSSFNTLANSSGGARGLDVESGANNNVISNCQFSGRDDAYGTLLIYNSHNNTVSNSTINGNGGAYAATVKITSNTNNTFVNNTFLNAATLLYLDSTASANTFCLNNFTTTTGVYVNDTNGGNFYNCTTYLNDDTGGTITHVGGYTIHTFPANGSFNYTARMNRNVEVLVVGGGGGGGSILAGGGGGGGLIYNASHAISAGTIAVTVGGGGAVNTSGGNSVFSSMTAIGGGRGGSTNNCALLTAAGTGGSGGGGGYQFSGASGTSGQGYAGGNGIAGCTSPYTTGGGGGAGGAGGSGNSIKSGDGGVGLSYNISGTPTYYAGGGGGSAYIAFGASIGIGGLGFGSNGTNQHYGGGGGGGSAGANGAGGNGIVIVRYLTNATNEGNIWANVINGSIAVRGSTASSIPGLYIGTTGAVPYTSANSGGKITGSASDAAPLTPTSALGCGALSTPNAVYTMSTNLTSATTCFNITAANVTLDCAGRAITPGSFSYGVYSTQAGTTVKNCVISGGDTGIWYVGAANGLVQNNTIAPTNTNGLGIRISSGSNGNSLLGNTITNAGSSAYGIYIEGGTSTNIDCQGKSLVGTNASGSYGVYSSQNSTTVRNCIISNFQDAIRFSAVNYGTIQNVTASSTHSTGTGIYISTGGNNKILNSVTNQNPYPSLWLIGTNYNIISDNIINGRVYGADIYQSSYNTFIRNNITADTAVGALLMENACHNNLFVSNRINGTSNYALRFYSANTHYNNTYVNNTFISTGTLVSYDSQSGSGNRFYWNNFTATSGAYINDSSGMANYYNTSNVSIASGLVAYWKLNEASNTAAADSAGSNTGTISGNYTWTTGRINNALSLSGGSMSAASAASLNFGTGSFSVEMWGKYRDFTYPKAWFMIKKSNVCYTAGSPGWDVGHTYNENGIVVCLSDGTANTGNAGITFDPGFRPSEMVNKWVHIVIVFDRSADKAKAYVNGAKQTNELDISAITGSVDNAVALTVGTMYGWSTDGTLDEIKLYNRALSANEVQYAYSVTAKPEGNVYANVMSGAVGVYGSTASTGYPPLYIGTGGAVPYTSANSGGKIIGSATDYAPLTPTTAIGCGVLSTANTVYTMSTNLSISATCFNVTAANVVLDCNGYTIFGNNASGAYGVFSNQLNTTVRNCNIRDFPYGISYSGASSGLIDRNNITTTSASGAYGVLLHGTGTNSNVVSNNIIAVQQNAPGGDCSGVFLGTGTGNVVASNAISANSNFQCAPIISQYSGTGHIIANNTISTTGANNSYGAIYLRPFGGTLSSYQILNNTITATAGASGIYVANGSSHTIDCQGRSITGTNTTGTYGIYSNQTNTTVKNCIISSFARAVLFEGATNSLMQNNTVLGGLSGYTQIYENGGSGNRIIGNNVTHLQYAITATGTGAVLANNTAKITSGTAGSRGYYVGTGALAINNSFTTTAADVTNAYTVGGANVTIDCQGASLAGANVSSSYGIYSDQLNTTIRNCNISNFYTGIYFNGATNGTIDNVNASSTSSVGSIPYASGIYIYSASPSSTINSYILINNTYASGAGYGLGLDRVHRNTIANTVGVGKTYPGIGLWVSGTNTFINVSGTATGAGVSIAGTGAYANANSNGNSFTGITASSTASHGVSIGADANNTSIDCQGKSITGTNTSATYGIYSAQFNTTVRNCQISNFATGIFFNGSTYGAIENVTASTTHASSHPSGTGIYLYNSASYNRITNSNANAAAGSGIFLSTSSSFNTIANSTGTSASNSGIYAYSGSGSNTFANCTGTSASDIGFALYQSSNNNITGSSGISTSSLGFYIDGGSSYNNITGSTGTSNSGRGFYISGSTGNIIRNSIASNLVSGAAGYGVHVLAGANNTQIINTTASSAVSSAIYIDGGSNVLVDCQGKSIVGTNTTGTYGVYTTQFNTTVKNCVISNFPIGIHYYGSSGGAIQNNTISSISLYGIHLNTSANSNDVRSNNILAGTSALRLWGASSNTLFNNTLNASSYGLFLDNSANSNTITRNSIMSSGTAVLLSASSNIIANNTISSTSGTGMQITWDYGNSLSNVLANNTISSSTGVGVYIVSGNDNTFTNNAMTSGTGTGLLFDNALAHDNTFAGGSISGATALSIAAADKMNFTNITFGSTTAHVSIAATSYGNTFCWNNFTATSGAYISDANGSNFYNSSICNNEGNVYANVMSGAVSAYGTVASAGYPSLYIGAYGAGVPYSSSTSGGKITGSAIDYAPLTPTSALGCGNLNTPNSVYTMVISLNSAATCFNVTAANVTINCAGKSITGTNASGTYGVYSNQAYTTVQNCNISNFATGIRFDGATSGLISSTNASTTKAGSATDGFGIYLVNSANSNTIISSTGSSASYFGIRLAANSINNNLTNSTGTSGSNIGILISSSSNNAALTGTTASSGTSSAIYIDGGSNVSVDCQGKSITGTNTSGTYGIYSNQFNTTVRNCQISNFDVGIYFSGATNGTISSTNASATAAGGFGIRLATGSNYNTIVNSTAISSYRGIQFDSNANNQIISSTAMGYGNAGVLFNTASSNTIIASQMSGRGNVSNNAGALVIYGGSQNNIIANSTLNGLAGAYAATLQTGANTGNRFAGNTLSNATTLIYLDASAGANTFYWNNFTSIGSPAAYINDSGTGNFYNTTLSGRGEGNIYANVLAGSPAVYGSTPSSGIPGMYIGIAGAGVPYSSSTSGGKITGSAVDYAPLTAASATTCGNLSSANTIYTLSVNLPSSGTCFTVTASNVTLNCNGYSLTGSNVSSSYGVYSNQAYTTVQNCNISNFDTGIYFNGAMNGTIDGNNVSTTINNFVAPAYSSAIVLYNGANYNTINNINASSTIGVGIYINSNYNTIANSSGTSGSNAGIELDSGFNTITNSTGTSTSNVGIYLGTSSYNSIINSAGINLASGANAYGIKVTSNSNNNNFTGTTASSAASSAIYINGGANNTIDCQGKSIVGTNATGTYGVYTNQYNTTIKNCNISSFQHGIYFVGPGGTNGTIQNTNAITTHASGHGIYLLYQTKYFSIINSTGTSTSGNGIRLENTASYNTLINSTGTSGSSYAVYVTVSSDYNTFINSTGTSNSNKGFYIESSSNNIINNSIARNILSGAAGYGLYITSGSNNNQVINSTASSAASSAIYIDGGSNNSIDCQGKSITGANASGTYGVYTSQLNTTIRNCNISNFNHAVYLASGATYASVSNSRLNTSYTDGAALYAAAGYGSFANITAEASSGNSSGVSGAFYIASNYNNVTNCSVTSSSSYIYHSAINVRGNGFNRLENNTFTATRGDAKAMYLYPSSYNTTLKGNNFTSALYAVWIESGVRGSIFEQNRFNGSSYGVGFSGYLAGPNYDNIFFANTFIGASPFALGAYGFNNTLYNNTFITPTGAGTLLSIGASSSGNRIYWNNFTATSGAYISDANGSNIYNTTISGNGEGNIYANVMDGTVNVGGIVPSTAFPALYIGTTGAVPYSSSASGGKIAGGAMDYAPLTRIYNTAPNITVVLHSPQAFASITDSINCSVTATDREQPNLTIQVEWYMDGANQSSLASSYAGAQNNTLTKVATLGSGNLSWGQIWLCKARAFDGYAYSGWFVPLASYHPPGIEQYVTRTTPPMLAVGQNWTLGCMAFDGSANSSWINSTSVIIGAHAPYGAQVVSYYDATNGHWFWVDASATDPAGAEDIVFTNISSSLGSCAYLSNTTSENTLTVRYNCTSSSMGSTTLAVGFRDTGNSYAQTDLDTHAYPNHVPGDPTNIAPSGGQNYVGDSSNAINTSWYAAGTPEPDGDAFNYSLEYSANSGVNWSFIANTTNAYYNWNTTALASLSTYRVRVRSIDAYGSASGYSSSVSDFSISHNTPPSVSAVSVSPASALTSDTINCTATLLDSEQSNLTAVYVEWYNHGAPNISNTFYNLPVNTPMAIAQLIPGSHFAGDVWSCRVRAYDGQEYSGWANSSGTSAVQQGCGAISASNSVYTLSGSLSYNGTCISITGSNVTINCNGYSITGANATGSYGIYSTATYTRVLNCNISNFQHGIYFNPVSDGLMQNDTVSTTHATGNAIYVQQGARNTITLTRATSVSGAGILLNSTDNNNVTLTNATSTSGHGVYLVGSTVNRLSSARGTSTSGSGIFLDAGSNSNTIASSLGSSASTQGMFFISSSSNNIINSTGTSAGGYGIAFQTGSNSNTVIGSNATSSVYAYGTQSNSNSNVFANGIISGKHNTYGALMLVGPTSNNTVANSTINGLAGTYAVTLQLGSANTGNMFINNTIMNATTLLYLDANAGANTFYWNNFTAIGSPSSYIIDAGSSNVYNSNAGARPGLVGYWKLDETSGTSAADSAGSNTGEVSGAAWTSGKHGNALSFNGPASYLSVPYNAGLAPTEAITFSSWFYTTNKTVAQRIISKTEGGGYQLSLNENGACSANTLCALLHVNGTYYAASVPISSISNNAWYYVTGAYDGSALKLYLNGAQMASTPASGAITYAFSNPLCIGSEPSSTVCTGGGVHFYGSIDEVKIYNRSLTATEIMAEYANSAATRGEGNIYANVMDRSVYVYGLAASTGFPSLVVGAGGDGHPYNAANSGGKISGNAADYAPLAPITALKCMPLSSPNTIYMMSSDLAAANMTASGMCFNVTAANVTLDCNGRTISGSNNSAASAVYAYGQAGFTMRNCIVKWFGKGVAIYQNSHHALIASNTFIDNWAAIHSNAWNTNDTFSGNSISSDKPGGMGISIAGNIYQQIADGNTIALTGSSAVGIDSYYCHYCSYSSNNITANAGSGKGIKLYGVSEFNNITNNTIAAINGYELLPECEGGCARNNTIDCAGRQTSGSNTSTYGIYIMQPNARVQNCSITGYSEGIRLSGENATITAVSVNARSYGIYLDACNGSTVSQSVVNQSGSLFGIYQSGGFANRIAGNDVTVGNATGIRVNYQSLTAGNNTITGNVAHAALEGIGLELINAANNTISGTIGSTSNGYGIYLAGSENNTIIGGSGYSGTQYGIYLKDSPYNTLVNATAQSITGDAIRISGSSDRNTLQNTVIDMPGAPGRGIYLQGVDYTNITGGNITTNSSLDNAAIYVYSGSDHTTISSLEARATSGGGISVFSSTYASISNVTAFSGSGNAISVLQGSSYASINNSTATSSSGAGIRVEASDYSSLNGASAVATGTGNGLHLKNSGHMDASGSAFSSSGGYSALFDASSSNTVYESSFISSTKGSDLLYLQGSSSANMFYWNNFTNTSGKYAEAESAGNSFTSTWGEGNAWHNVLNGSVSICGFARTVRPAWQSIYYVGEESSSGQYPYNASVSGNKLSGAGAPVDTAPMTPQACSGASAPLALRNYTEPDCTAKSCNADADCMGGKAPYCDAGCNMLSHTCYPCVSCEAAYCLPTGQPCNTAVLEGCGDATCNAGVCTSDSGLTCPGSPALACCPSSTCTNGTCVAKTLVNAACTDSTQCTPSAPVCVNGACKACIPAGSSTQCSASAECCARANGGAGLCSSSTYTCVELLPVNSRTCAADADCMSGLYCKGGTCLVNTAPYAPVQTPVLGVVTTTASSGTTVSNILSSTSPTLTCVSNCPTATLDPDKSDQGSAIKIQYLWQVGGTNATSFWHDSNTFNCELLPNGCGSNPVILQSRACDKYGACSAPKASASFTPPLRTQTCMGTGQPCGTSGYSCCYGRVCSGGACKITDPTLNCTSSAQCLSGLCIPNSQGVKVCVNRLALGDNCTNTYQCPSGAYCINSVCSSCIPAGTPSQVCTSSSQCCGTSTGLAGFCDLSNTTSQTYLHCVVQQLNSTCQVDTDCGLFGSAYTCQKTSTTSTYGTCQLARTAASPIGGACLQDSDCSQTPASAFCDLLNRGGTVAIRAYVTNNTLVSDYGQCMASYAPYTLCNGAHACAYGYACLPLAGSSYCVANSSTGVQGFSGWARVGAISMEASHSPSKVHSGLTSARISGADPSAYAYNMVLMGALQGESAYLLEFWAQRENSGTTLAKYALYDSMNNAWLSGSGTWLFAASNTVPTGGIITEVSISDEWMQMVRVFKTLKNAKIQLRFYAPDSGAYYADDVSVSEANDFSMLAWVRADSPQAGGTLFSQVGRVANKLQGINWSIAANNTLYLNMYSSSRQGATFPAGTESISPSVSLADGKWHQVALSVHRSSYYMVYLDGVLAGAGQFTLGSMETNATMFIGGNGTGSGFTGELGEVRFYKRALTPADIKGHYEGWFQQLCKIDVSVKYSNTAAKNLTATYNAELKIRKLLPETVLSMPFDVEITSDSPGMITDYSRFLGAGTKTGAVWVSSGKVGGAYEFNAGGRTADRIVLPSALIGATGDFTVAAWVNSTDLSSYHCVLCSFSPSSTGGLFFGTYNNYPFIGVGTGGTRLTASTPLSTGAWYHLAAVRSGTTVTYYVNGVKSIYETSSMPFTTASTLAIGNTPDALGGYGFKGRIDEVRVISRALTDAEVLSVYKDNSLVSSQILPLSQQ